MANQQPLSTSELAKLAVVHVDSRTSIRLYIRSLDLLIKQARVYKTENDLQHAYILYMKYSSLTLNELPKHGEYEQLSKSIRNTLKKNCLEALDELEWMKPKLDTLYEESLKKQRSFKTVAETSTLRTSPKEPRSPTDKEQTQEWSLQQVLQGIPGVGHEDRKKIHQHETSSNNQLTIHYPSTPVSNQSDGHFRGVGYHQPVVIPHTPMPHLQDRTVNLDSRPAIPPKIPNIPELPRHTDVPPAIPPKIKLPHDPILEKWQYQDIASGVTTESGMPLRSLVVSKMIQHKFLSIASNNTQRDIETCGILAGKLKNNILTITTLIIPKQTGTSDTCVTENEEELFEYQDKHDLLTFGWIHTHPSQSCFLSSVDLHTHCSYQLMLPEAIAIVCSPKHKPDFGIFRLTDPPGLDVISSCKARPLFHPHPDVPIYKEAKDPGHVRMSDYHIQVVDLR